jgi:hypothetical protein
MEQLLGVWQTARSKPAEAIETNSTSQPTQHCLPRQARTRHTAFNKKEGRFMAHETEPSNSR